MDAIEKANPAIPSTNSPGESVSVIIPVYEDGYRAFSAVRALLAQELPGSISLTVTVVDDGSRVNRAVDAVRLPDSRVRILELPSNRGRSIACNEGAWHANSDFVAFMDCDCEPANVTFLAEHLHALRRGFVASTGPVIGTGYGFWHRYQQDAALRRRLMYQRGLTYSGSSTNCVVKRHAFQEVGGFDTGYRQYGFEDRDLLIRLSGLGRIAWAAHATVRHLDTLTLAQVCSKLATAGEYSSNYFSERHANAYRLLGYASIDARKHPWLHPIGKLLGPRLPMLAKRIEPYLHKRYIPYLLSKSCVKLFSAIAFVYGTTRAS